MEPDVGVEMMIDMLSTLQSSVMMILQFELSPNGPIRNYQIYSLTFIGQGH